MCNAMLFGVGVSVYRLFPKFTCIFTDSIGNLFMMHTMHAAMCRPRGIARQFTSLDDESYLMDFQVCKISSIFSPILEHNFHHIYHKFLSTYFCFISQKIFVINCFANWSPGCGLLWTNRKNICYFTQSIKFEWLAVCFRNAPPVVANSWDHGTNE